MTESAHQLYWGDLHRQSNVSDGEGDLVEHFRVARDEARLDFYAMTDHAILTADPCDRAHMGMPVPWANGQRHDPADLYTAVWAYGRCALVPTGCTVQ